MGQKQYTYRNIKRVEKSGKEYAGIVIILVVFFNRNVRVFTYTERLYDQAQKNLHYQNLIIHISSSMTVPYLAMFYSFKHHIQYQPAFYVFTEKNPQTKQNAKKT